MAVVELKPSAKEPRTSGRWRLPMLVFALVFAAALGVDRAMTARAGPSLQALEPTAREVSSDIIQTARAPFAPPPDQHFANCSAAHSAGRYSIPVGDPSYRSRMDGDGDGLACEPYRH